MAESVDQAEAGGAGAGGAVPGGIGAAGGSFGLAPVSDWVAEVSVGAVVGGGAFESVPVGAGGAGRAYAQCALVEAALAGA